MIYTVVYILVSEKMNKVKDYLTILDLSCI